MKQIFIIICAIIISFNSYGQTDKNHRQLTLHSFKESASASGLPNLMALFNQDKWPKDNDGNEYCALVRVTFENMPANEARNVSFNFGNSAPLKTIQDHIDDPEHELWLFVTPSGRAFMEAKTEKYGASNRLPDLSLKPKHIYDVVLKNDKTISINIITIPQGATATLETGQRATTNATITDVALGSHTLTISKDGRTLKKENINVTEDNVKFEYDLRETKRIRFESDPKGATLYVNDKECGTTPCELTLPFDSYSIKAMLGPGESDVKSITVNRESEDIIKMEPVKKKKFEVYAIYNGSKVDADLYIDGKSSGTHQPSYTLELPIGKTYNMNMMYYGNGKKRKIRVTPNMSEEQMFKISARNRFVWPWQREYDACPAGVSASYVTKQLVTTGEGEKLKENGVWPDGQNKSLHGMQFGFHLQPCFSFGLGLYTGLFYELYLSSNDDYDYNNFQEHCLYLPVHGFFRLPLGKKVALSVHGGLGFNYSVYGTYTSKEDYIEDFDDFYGEDGFPKRFNMAAEIGAGLRLGPIQLNFQYSKGINDHESYTTVGDYKTVQNKYTFGISYMISSDE